MRALLASRRAAAAAIALFGLSALPAVAATTRYEQNHASVTYTGVWHPNGNSRHSGGSAALALDVGARATFSFSGHRVVWRGVRDPWCGIARVFVDGALRASVDTYSATEQLQAPLYAVNDLTEGPHVLVIEITGERNPAAASAWIWIDAFDVESGTVTPPPTATATATPLPRVTPTPTATPAAPTPTPAPGGTTRYQQDHPAVTYMGTWYTNNAGVHSGGSAAAAKEPIDRVTLTFTGTGVSLIGYQDEWSGLGRVFLDGALAGTVDFYRTPQRAQAVLFTASGLAPGTHTLAVEPTGTRNPASDDNWIWIDAFDVTTGSSTPTPTARPRVTATPTATPAGPTPTPTAGPTPTPGPSGWQCFSPRTELQPACALDTATFRSAPDSLSIGGAGNPAVYGGWARSFPVTAGQSYQLTAYYQATAVEDTPRRVVARIDWTDAAGARVGIPDYAYKVTAEGAWQRVTAVAPAPAGASQARVELLLAWDANGTVRWDDVSLVAAAPLPDRTVRIGTVAYRPTGAGGKDGNVNEVLAVLDQIGPSGPDIFVLCEGIPRVSNGFASADSLAETVPGPITDRMGAKARQYNMYIVAAIYERDGGVIYNTAFLLDRGGNLVGKYRKVYLPFEEVEYGLTPGDAYPSVLTTDFGKVALFICWDAQYSDVARAMAAQGAEILLLPTWGGDFGVMKARAAENHVYLVTSGYDVETAIVDPTGAVLYSVPRASSTAVTNVMPITLRERVLKPDVGDMRARIHKELRWDVPDPPGVR